VIQGRILKDCITTQAGTASVQTGAVFFVRPRIYRRGRTTGVRRAAFKSCCNNAISDGVSIRGVFEVASFRPGKFVEAKSEVLPPPPFKFRLLAGRRLAGENRQLSVESTLVGGPRFAAGDIGGEARIFFQHTRSVQPAQHRHHQ
jgi:hypothetical protein